MGLTVAHANTILGAAIASPDPMYLALLDGLPAPTASGTTMPEVDYPGYARVAIDADDWSAPANGEVSLGVALSFPAVGSGTVRPRAFGLLDAATAGNLLWYGALPEMVFYSTDPEPPTLGAGGLVLGINRTQ